MLKNAPIVPYIPVADVARARKFYEEKVGLKPKEEYAGGVVYECGKGSWVFMYPSPGAGTSKASTAFWAVDDVEAEVAELKARGVVFARFVVLIGIVDWKSAVQLGVCCGSGLFS
jgi:predicted enzyme related to lactoylglutathione lyase